MTPDPPIPILDALEMLFVTLARGCPALGPYWSSPRGGKQAVAWMPSTESYRFTIDLRPPLPFPAEYPK